MWPILERISCHLRNKKNVSISDVGKTFAVLAMQTLFNRVTNVSGASSRVCSEMCAIILSNVLPGVVPYHSRHISSSKNCWIIWRDSSDNVFWNMRGTTVLKYSIMFAFGYLPSAPAVWLTCLNPMASNVPLSTVKSVKMMLSLFTHPCSGSRILAKRFL